jgi:anthranilate phosphoribosyltransferase
VHARDGLDEISLSAPTFIYELRQNEIREISFDFASLGFKPVSLQQLQGGDAFFNADIIRAVLNGKAAQAQRNIVLINAAFGIHVSGKSDSLKQAQKMAVESIDSGAALQALKRMSEATNDMMNIS